VHGILDARGLHSLPARARHPDVAVNLHGRGPQSHRLLLEQRPGETLWFASAAVAASRGSPRWRPSEHEVMRWCRMLAESGVPCRPDRLELRAPAGPPPAGSRGATLLHPGAASPARRWPAARFAEVARAEASRGRRVMITGSRGDLPSAHRIAARAGLPDRSVLAGRTTLADLARAIAAAGRVVCGDTGVAHLATAFGTPSVVLFGPVSPAEWGPPHDRMQHRALWAGRRGDPHGARPDPGLLEISAGDVIEALEELPV
jgi:ADP-heptose:LPS heptosyltransferase